MAPGSRFKIWHCFDRVVKQVKKKNADGKFELDDKKKPILERQVWGYCKMERNGKACDRKFRCDQLSASQLTYNLNVEHPNEVAELSNDQQE